MGSVFISHSWNDKPLARKLAEILQNFAVSVWLDEAEIKIGDSLIEKIREGINQVDYVIALLSKDAVSSGWVKKELDVAMNQEIEGKKVKVLPILAGPCSLPLFLKGKLYADMSTPKAFKKSLPMLLVRLGVSQKILTKIKEGKPVEEVTKDSKHVLEIVELLNSKNSPQQYTTLKSLESYKHKNILIYPQVLEAITSFIKSGQPTHIRLEALRVIGLSEDSNFAYLVEPLIKDENLTVAIKAIETLTNLKSFHSVKQISEILVNTKNNQLVIACLDFFSKVSVKDDADAFSIISLVENWRSKESSNLGTELRVVRILLKQWNGNRDEILEKIIGYLESQYLPVRIEILDKFMEFAGKEDLWISRMETKDLLKQSMQKVFETGTVSEIAKAWLACFLWYDFNRKDIWDNILNAQDNLIKALLFDIETEMYRIKYLFNEPEDVYYLIQLIDKVKNPLRQNILNLLAEIQSEEAIKTLVKYQFKPKGWIVYHVLIGLAEMGKWDYNYNNLLNVTIKNATEFKTNSITALILLAQFNSGKISIETLIKEFPRKDISDFRVSLHEIKNILNKLKKNADKSYKQLISKLIKSISGEEDY